MSDSEVVGATSTEPVAGKTPMTKRFPFAVAIAMILVITLPVPIFVSSPAWLMAGLAWPVTVLLVVVFLFVVRPWIAATPLRRIRQEQLRAHPDATVLIVLELTDGVVPASLGVLLASVGGLSVFDVEGRSAQFGWDRIESITVVDSKVKNVWPIWERMAGLKSVESIELLINGAAPVHFVPTNNSGVFRHSPWDLYRFRDAIRAARLPSSPK